MPKIELVLTDVDGTLVKLLKNEVSDRVRQAIIATENAGVRVVPVTGRPYEMAEPVLNLLGFDGLCVLDNGASIREVKTGELVWSQWLDTETVREITRILLPFAKTIDYAGNYDEHEPTAGEEKLVTHPAAYVFALIDSAELEHVQQLLKHIPDIICHGNPRANDPSLNGLQVNHRLGTKFHGTEALRKIEKTKVEHTMAVGDGFNDVPLFENAALKIAMGNAADILKAKADYVVGTIDEDGFAEAIDRFVLSPHKA